MELRLNKFVVVPVTGHYEGDKLIDEQEGRQQSIYAPDAFMALWQACEVEIEQRNAAAVSDAGGAELELVAGHRERVD